MTSASRLGGVFLLILGICAAYWPALDHAPRADQVAYLAEVADVEGIGPLLRRSLTIERTGTWSSGDERLFRPLLRVLHSVEYAVFGRDWRAWQALGLIAHGFAVFALWRVLRRIGSGPFPILLSAFWAASWMGAEAVVWHHITGYVVFVALALFAVERWMVVLARSDEGLTSLAVLAFLLPACLLHELGCVLSVLLALPLVARRRWREAVVLCSAPAVYAVLNVWSIWTSGVDVSSPVFDVGVVRLGVRVIEAVFWWTCGTLFPELTRHAIGDRVTASWEPDPPIASPSMLLGTITLLVGLIALWRGRSALNDRDRRALLFPLCGSLAILPCLVVLARTADFRLSLAQGLYYAHPFWAFLLPAVWTVASAGRAVRMERFAAAGILLAMTAVGAQQIWNVNVGLARWSRPRLALLSELESFTSDREHEPGLSFWTPQTTFDVPFLWMRKREDPREGHPSYRLAQVLYPREWSAIAPSYVLLPIPARAGQRVSVPRTLLGVTEDVPLCVDWGDGIRTSGEALTAHRYRVDGLFLAVIQICAESRARLAPPMESGLTRE